MILLDDPLPKQFLILKFSFIFLFAIQYLLFNRNSDVYSWNGWQLLDSLLQGAACLPKNKFYGSKHLLKFCYKTNILNKCGYCAIAFNLHLILLALHDINLHEFHSFYHYIFKLHFIDYFSIFTVFLKEFLAFFAIFFISILLIELFTGLPNRIGNFGGHTWASYCFKILVWVLNCISLSVYIVHQIQIMFSRIKLTRRLSNNSIILRLKTNFGLWTLRLRCITLIINLLINLWFADFYFQRIAFTWLKRNIIYQWLLKLFIAFDWWKLVLPLRRFNPDILIMVYLVFRGAIFVIGNLRGVCIKLKTFVIKKLVNQIWH